ncbi:GrxA family glutaredoxin [Psittacicella melopsittaci]|uniref:GrxA family glutaredoxin n=1 Tax=Psittacicella melopsittaci TaxID=2028576 RepID=A0A3A1YA42_9GAMM|nr:GrxA family glutaredoxin [Psittacicella melopsittaci]RIY34058.1 GrxA family glutaredoxin [Psittacicella melopsittaci]
MTKRYSIEIFGRPNCPYCHVAKDVMEQLKDKGHADGVYHDMIEEGITKEDLAAKAGKEVRTVPQVFVNGNHIGGCDDFLAYLREDGYLNV